MVAEAELTFAFAAGVFVTVSPCSFPLLPGYFTYLLGSQSSAKRALTAGVTSTLGLMTSLSALGAIAAAVGSVLLAYLPYIEFAIAAFIIVLGILMLSNVSLPALLPVLRPSGRRGLLGLYTFGLAYGLAASACAAPIFFSVLLFSLLGGILEGITTFVAYAFGIGVILTAVSFFVSEANDFFTQRLGRITYWLHRVGGLGLIAAGVYLFYVFSLGVGLIPV